LDSLADGDGDAEAWMGTAIGELGPPVLFIDDLDRSKAFYVDTLGFTLGFEDDTSAGLFVGEDMFMLVTVASGEDMLTGETLSTPKGQRPTGLFNIFVEDVDAAFEQLKAKGVEFIVEPIDRYWGRRTAHFKDPDGVVWEISQSIE
jgi:lactoylglutathione lyase